MDETGQMELARCSTAAVAATSATSPEFISLAYTPGSLNIE